MASTMCLFILIISVCLVFERTDCLNTLNGDSVIMQNERPIIGVLVQKITSKFNRDYPNSCDGRCGSYIAASYIKFVEGAGGRAIPIWIDQPEEYYEDILQKINGVLLPGGSSWFNETETYADAGRHIYDIAIKMNENGNFMPIWGTCLGFELLTYLSANNIEHRANCRSQKQSLPLNFKPDYKNSRLFGSAPNDVIEILSTKDVTANFHQFCVTEQNMTDYGIIKYWTVMSTNKDWNGFEFVSSIEHKKYPFYGVQFHPEKNLYEWINNRNISHSADAIKASQYFADFFIDEARKNLNHFKNISEENAALIYNYNPIFTGSKGSAFTQSYLFPNDVYRRPSSTNACQCTSPLLILIVLITSLINLSNCYYS